MLTIYYKINNSIQSLLHILYKVLYDISINVIIKLKKNDINNKILEKSNININKILSILNYKSVIFIKRCHILLTTVDHKRLRVMYLIFSL